jgi:hypothetical protein
MRSKRWSGITHVHAEDATIQVGMISARCKGYEERITRAVCAADLHGKPAWMPFPPSRKTVPVAFLLKARVVQFS